MVPLANPILKLDSSLMAMEFPLDLHHANLSSQCLFDVADRASGAWCIAMGHDGGIGGGVCGSGS